MQENIEYITIHSPQQWETLCIYFHQYINTSKICLDLWLNAFITRKINGIFLPSAAIEILCAILMHTIALINTGVSRIKIDKQKSY